jgi:hypothetical protein
VGVYCSASDMPCEVLPEQEILSLAGILIHLNGGEDIQLGASAPWLDTGSILVTACRRKLHFTQGCK